MAMERGSLSSSTDIFFYVLDYVDQIHAIHDLPLVKMYNLLVEYPETCYRTKIICTMFFFFVLSCSYSFHIYDLIYFKINLVLLAVLVDFFELMYSIYVRLGNENVLQLATRIL